MDNAFEIVMLTIAGIDLTLPIVAYLLERLYRRVKKERHPSRTPSVVI